MPDLYYANNVGFTKGLYRSRNLFHIWDKCLLMELPHLIAILPLMICFHESAFMILLFGLVIPDFYHLVLSFRFKVLQKKYKNKKINKKEFHTRRKFLFFKSSRYIKFFHCLSYASIILIFTPFYPISFASLSHMILDIYGF